MKAEFLLEIGTEELPAGFMTPAREALVKMFSDAMTGARIGVETVETMATPRRLILRADGVDTMQTSHEIEKTGPPKAQAYDDDGKPTKACIGFAKSQGVDVSDLIIVETAKGEQVAVRKVDEGRPTIDVLAEIVPGLLEKIPFPKTMRWMDLDVRFGRPIHWIVALFGGTVVPFSYGNIESGALSRGHRFTHPGELGVSSFDELRRTLESQKVIIDPEARKDKIRKEVSSLVDRRSAEVLEDEELLDEITYLVESPYPVKGEFPEDFLELPASILITCMKKHQRYFAVQDKKERITNKFIAVNNTPVKDPDVSVKGHERVLKARLEDARFYFKEDRKAPLIDRLDALKGVVFHSKLGTSYEKVERFTKLACKLAERFAPDRTADVERAAKLAKCDLETGIVYEFPELQGIIGSYYAKLDSETDDVASAVREHYLPAYAGDRLPKTIIGSLVSIADRLDTIAGCFSVGLIPTGGADPYALRRHALGIIQIVIGIGKPLDMERLVADAIDLIGEKRTRNKQEVLNDIMEFIRTRFVNFHTSRGFSLDVVEAAVRARFDDLTDARRRVEALEKWKKRDDFDDIMIGFKRVVNILKNTEPGTLDPKVLTEDQEKELHKVFMEVRARAEPLIADGDYEKALETTAELKGPIDSFFDHVMVMDKDEKLKNNRLALLKEIADFFNRMADFSFIGSTAQ